MAKTGNNKHKDTEAPLETENATASL